MNQYHNHTPRLQKALAVAAKIAKDGNHSYVGTEHVFIALLKSDSETIKNALAHYALIPEMLVEYLRSHSGTNSTPPKDATKELLTEATSGLRKLADLLEGLTK